MAEIEEDFEVTLNDIESDKNYYLILNKQDANRLQEDEMFAQQLLNYAKIHKLDKPRERNESDENNTHRSLTTLLSICTINERISQRHNIDVTDRVNWSYEAVTSLIQSMDANIEYLSHPKKENVFENVSNDLLSKEFLFTPEQCAQKWKRLERSYKTAKGNQNKSGRSPSRFFFFEKIDNILVTKLSNSCKHALESSEEINRNNAEYANGEHTDANSEVTDIDASDKRPILKKKRKQINEEYLELKKRY
ncbi:hypothetical protein NQ315_014009 [Exocentrus adspersus]|uniref:Myb/SANT-like DNA-binding domain-containing protein n=1 Tax=Exocentrus adspersus TaxID=1586481 RepID=A0AAV8V6E1_9CUCU|nr:hypothetical protein NQ315_014009 [Exocentrus adspersus]